MKNWKQLGICSVAVFKMEDKYINLGIYKWTMYLLFGHEIFMETFFFQVKWQIKHRQQTTRAPISADVTICNSLITDGHIQDNKHIAHLCSCLSLFHQNIVGYDNLLHLEIGLRSISDPKKSNFGGLLVTICILLAGSHHRTSEEAFLSHCQVAYHTLTS